MAHTNKIQTVPAAKPVKVALPFTNVLVADDNYASRTIMKTLLEREGCQVNLAHNGRVAVQLSELDRFCLILMDLQMPILGGLEASQSIRAHCPKNQVTPIFAVTAYADPTIAESVKTVGVNAIVLKPFRTADILDAWQKTVDKKALTTRETQPNIPDTAIDFALLDRTVLIPLCTAASPTVLRRIIERFWVSSGELIEIMQAELPGAIKGDTASLEAFRKTAHSLKGAAANIGILKGRALAAQLQNIHPAHIEATLYALMQCLSHTRPEMDSFIKAHAKPS